MKTLASPIVKDSMLPQEILFSAENAMMIYPDLYGEGELKFLVDDFNQYWKECMDNGYLSEQQQKEILSNCFAFIKETVRSLFSRFPEMDFILHH